jgi:glycosyltransferase involved in cell wall biosynthesis
MTRLLNINNYHYRRSGSEVVYFEHAALMERRGFECGYFSMHHPKNEATPWSEYFVDELEVGHDYGLLQKAVMAAKVVWSWEARSKLSRLLDKFPAQLAHLHCVYHHLSPAILPLLRERGVRTVMTAHDLKIACPAYKMLNRGGVCERCRDGSVLNVIRHRCVRDSLAASAVVAVESGLHRALGTWKKHLDRVVCPSRFFRDKLVEWGWPAEQLLVVPNVVDATRFEPAFDPGDYLLYFGRLAPEKGVATLLRSAAKAGVALKIAGTGPEEAALRALPEAQRADVEFVGFRSGEALHALVRGARAVVLPSEWYENAPMSVLESMALGKPVLGARIGGIPELIDDGATGWLFSSGDVTELAERLREVKLASATTLVSMGQAARRSIVENYTQRRYTDAMLAIYAQLKVDAPSTT